MKNYMAAAAWLALSATSAHAAADTAQKKPCITPIEAQALVTAIAPHAIKSVTEACSPTLPTRAYLRMNGDDLAKRYQLAAAAARPAAISAFGKISGSDEPVTPEMFDAFAGPLIAELIAKDIKPDVCEKIDRIAALLDPLPATNLAGLVAAIFEFAADDSKKAPPFEICKP
ncbi:hypothetical protein AB2M62_08170 [Sphingomonas sp. MMS12-HWE2-04]|uniref:hypothetical protein n=1 Tax=Sphingomonas sp. MMS12-HWE2-04 TaxID=3234199 RepID=UPI0038512C1B